MTGITSWWQRMTLTGAHEPKHVKQIGQIGPVFPIVLYVQRREHDGCYVGKRDLDNIQAFDRTEQVAIYRLDNVIDVKYKTVVLPPHE